MPGSASRNSPAHAGNRRATAHWLLTSSLARCPPWFDGGGEAVNLSRNGYRERFTRPSASYQLTWVTALSLLTVKT